jgi:cell division protein FtsI (penicillin-binding protein 3)
MAQTFDTTKPLHRGRFTISDYHPEKFRMTVPEVFMHSSNIGAALMGEMMGAATLKKFYGDLGLLHQISIEIDEVGKPMLPRPWGELSTLTASFGHGISVTPLQTVSAASSIVNGGIRVNPTLILDRAATDKDKAQTRVVSAETAHRMRQLLRLVVTEGTATQADVVGYNVGGKTGTAEKIVNGRYAKGKNISSFIGFFPIDAPRYAILVMVDEPKGTKKSYGFATGGWVAAPAAGRIVESMAPLLGMKPKAVRPETDIATPLKKYIHGHEDDTVNNGGEVAQR